MGFLWWILFGLLAGTVAKFLMPGRDGGGIILTIVLGIIGAVVGGFIGTQFGWGDANAFDFRSFLLAVGGAMVVLFLYRMLARGR